MRERVVVMQPDINSLRLCLGTVQLGTKYGVANAIGRQPTEHESFDVLHAAIGAGIKYFDTASVYGNAEEVLGDFGIGEHGVNVISKLKPDLPDDENSVVDEIKKSCERMRVKSLYGYMLHRASDFYHDGIRRRLLKAREMGLVSHVGVSIYEPEDALAVARDGEMDLIQIPYNVLDQRLDETDFFELAEKNKVQVFARSAFLQGLLLMDVNKIPNNIIEARPFVEKFQHISKEYGFSPAEAAMLYSLNHSGIGHVVFGVDTETQLEENIKIASRLIEFEECYKTLRGAFDDVPRKVIVPSLW